jgi:transposase
MAEDSRQTALVAWLIMLIVALSKRIQELETKLGEDSTSSSRPPSTDSPHTRPKRTDPSREPKRRGARKGHPGHSQTLLEPTEEHHVQPEMCACGCPDLEDQGIFYTHQEVELPEVKLTVRHFLLHKGRCCQCGKLNKAIVPQGHGTGYGPRLSGLIALLSGDHGDSRETVQRFCRQILGLHISIGAVQKVINRTSRAILPHYEAIRERVHQAAVNHVDETPWYQARGQLHWLWVMGNRSACFFMIHARRTKEAFKQLIHAWEGILVSDDYGTYRKWVNLHQTCLAHLIRKAKGLARHKDPGISRCGTWACKELKLLVAMANAPPNKGTWRAFYARLCKLIKLYKDREDQAGQFVRSLERLLCKLWIFLQTEGVEPTNNLAERLLRRAVLWRKRSFGTESDSGDRWVERSLTLHQTCRLQGRSSYPVLVDALDAYLNDKEPDLSWIESL